MLPDATMSTLSPGDLLDHYRIERVVARGGMSVLYQATDTEDGTLVALKLPNTDMESDPILSERFRREEEIGLLLDHPGIVRTFHSGRHSRTYMVIEWVEGRLLRTVLNQDRILPPERATALILELCDAMDFMHKHGVVHRDLKPENVMVLPGDKIKLIDFGIAMKEDARRITHAGMSAALGTPDYISPEQVKGQRGDQRSDIYALGVIFYEMLTGRPPFEGPNPLAVMNERLLHDPKPARELNKAVTPELQEVLNRALQRDPRHRYATASEMTHDLEHPEELGVEEDSRRSGPLGVKLPNSRRLALYAALALVPLALFVLMLLLARR